MTTRTDRTDVQPDLTALRARYERANQTSSTGLASGILMLAGLYLALSPWVIQSIGEFSLAASNMITGVAVALLAVGFARSFGNLHVIAWVTPVIGAWAIVSPWVIYRRSGIVPIDSALVGPMPTATWLSNVIAGGVVLLAGLALGLSGGRGGHAREGRPRA
ncbi:SPW repeat protein [Amycolatopsis samaneae]|uniref:SPW repeat protein n=1 Tax=Amycolatopsis samaneae TaxID=664691 RepID=A0ABW5GW94_9PSEU